MAKINLPQPPIMRGDSPEQMANQMYTYLFQISEQLNVVLNDLSEDNFVEAVKRSINTGGNAPATERDMRDQYSKLRSLIISTADEVYSEMDVLRKSLSSTYMAISDFGTYEEDIFTDFIADSTGILMQTDVIRDLNGYVTNMNGYIKAGLLDISGEDEIFGVEIGQRDESGEAPDMVRITPTRIGFYQGGAEACYISNGRWGAPGIDVDNNIVYKGKWESGVDSSNRFYLRYVGG